MPTGLEQADGFLHFFEGWVIFGFCVALLLLTAAILQRTLRQPKSLSETIEVDFDGMGGQLARGLNIRPSRGLGVAAALTGLVALSVLFSPERAHDAPLRNSFARFPDQLGDWSGRTYLLDPDIERVLGADDYINAIYVHPQSSGPVSFFSAWYVSQTSGEGLHSPEVCLPADGWEIFSLEQRRVAFPEATYGSFEVNRAVIQKGLDKQLVYYWFEQRGRRMTNDISAKMVVVWDELTRQRSDGAIVRVVTPIADNETEADAEARLQALLTKALPELPAFVPE